ncbi:MAG TPA: putative quinol monooxygenase [Verrucomicrobiae bacterium]|nr:putative quinol monooxygenase [Verrucomicrobiae bacterium]
MNEKLLVVIARVKAKPGKEIEVMNHLKSLVEPSRKDAGCVNYDLHRNQDEPGSFLFHETWHSREHLERHLAKPDLQAALAKLGPLVAVTPEIGLWEKIL